jgi:transposase
MYNNQKFWVVTEANVLSNDTIGTQVYAYTGDNAKEDAYNKLYRLWSYGVKPDTGETRQYFSATLTEYDGNRAVMLESKVFDYRQPEPAPEPEDEPEEES